MLGISRRLTCQLTKAMTILTESSQSNVYYSPRSQTKTLNWPMSQLERGVNCGQKWLSTGKKEEEALVIYKGRWMVPFYVLVRLKVIQLVGLGALALPINTWLHKGIVDASVVFSSGLVVIGSIIASTTLWYYSKRYIGALALMGVKKDIVRFSVMNFWGTRTEEEYSLDSVIPPLRGLTDIEKLELFNKVLIPLDVIGGRQYFFSIKHGYILDKEMLIRLLDGSHMRDTYALENDP